MAKEDHSKETSIFDDKKFHFRIPALVYIEECSTFLAFAERRMTAEDVTATNLVMSRGQRQDDCSLRWSPGEDVMEATMEDYRTMNPCPIFEKTSKTLFLFFICLRNQIPENKLKKGETRLAYVTSRDYGRTWSKLEDLTSVIDSHFGNHQTFAVGPGHGLQLSSGTLLVPAYVKEFTAPNRKDYIHSHSVVLCSDDYHSWYPGRSLVAETGECQVAEVDDDAGTSQVYLNARSNGRCRVEMVSANGGANFTPLDNKALPEIGKGCQGSVWHFPARDGKPKFPLFFSYPTKGKDWDRENLGLYMKKSLKDPLDEHRVIHEGPSGYSDLSGCGEEGRVACLMECRVKDRSGCILQKDKYRHRIIFKEFNVHDLFSAKETHNDQ